MSINKQGLNQLLQDLESHPRVSAKDMAALATAVIASEGLHNVASAIDGLAAATNNIAVAIQNLAEVTLAQQQSRH